MQFSAHNADLHYEVSGPENSGRPLLLLLHFFGGSSRTWNEVVARLSGEFLCVAPDLRGFGLSASASGGTSVAQNADDVEALLQLLEQAPGQPLSRAGFVLAGHSMGGKVALEVAARRPKYLRALVLLAPSPPTPEPMSEDERERLRAAWGQREATEETVRSITARALAPEVFERTVQDELRCSRAAWDAWLDSGSREDISPRASRVQVPVTVVAGELDEGMTPQVLEREVVARVPGSRLHVLPGCKHLLPLDAPEEVAALIRRAAS